MNDIMTFVQNKYIYVPFFLWFGIQLFKLLHDLVKTKKFNFKRIMGAGGMPSSHSAVVTGIATLIGKYEGVGSPLFALSFLFAFIVMYDACGVRRAAGNQARLLNKKVDILGKALYKSFNEEDISRYILGYLINIDYFSKEIIELDELKNILNRADYDNEC